MRSSICFAVQLWSHLGSEHLLPHRNTVRGGQRGKALGLCIVCVCVLFSVALEHQFTLQELSLISGSGLPRPRPCHRRAGSKGQGHSGLVSRHLEDCGVDVSAPHSAPVPVVSPSQHRLRPCYPAQHGRALLDGARPLPPLSAQVVTPACAVRGGGAWDSCFLDDSDAF